MVPQEPVFKGATRPAMKFGVPLVPLVVLGGSTVLVALWGGLLISWWVAAFAVAIAAPTFGWMRFVTRRDDQRFRQLVIATRLRRHDRNRAYWQARSYTPTVYRGGRDARTA